MGLRTRLPLAPPPQPRFATLARLLQRAQAAQLDRRPTADQPRSQPPWAGQLESPLVYALLSALQVIISIVLIFLVLLHSGKDTGLSGAFGIGGAGAGPFGGGSLVERNLNRWTVVFGVALVINTLILLKI